MKPYTGKDQPYNCFMFSLLIKESEEEGEAPKPDEIQAGLVTPVEGYVC